MKKILVLGLCLVFSGVTAQDMSSYTYILVPKKFTFLKDTNQYQLNTLTKFWFEEKGFSAVYDDALPEDLQRDVCRGLKAEVENNSNMFVTRLRIHLRDCKNTVILSSDEGMSREKDYKKAYQEALKKAFTGIRAASSYKFAQAIAGTPAAVEEKPAQTEAPMLYAQPVGNGFQLVDSSPKVVYILQKTGLENVYILKDKNGILYKKEETWFLEYYENGTWMRKAVTIKF